eukprot:scaffold16750_cov58-Phaeocystis_antarctica.AAC.2
MHLACTLPAPRLNSSPNPSPPAQQLTPYSLQRVPQAAARSCLRRPLSSEPRSESRPSTST